MKGHNFNGILLKKFSNTPDFSIECLLTYTASYCRIILVYFELSNLQFLQDLVIAYGYKRGKSFY